MPDTAPPPTTVPFSAQIRTATERQHADAENSTFMSDMLGGILGVDAFYRYTGQLWHVYRALETHWDTLADDPVAGPFVRPELARLAHLEDDLAHLGGADWRAGVQALPSTAAYAARIEECARQWPAGYVAHHYTRYLGDLSGGQVIRGTAEKLWQLPKRGDGVRFYVFDQIPNPAAFKREYRELLDRLAVDDLEKQRVLGECQRAFAFNTAMFRELAAEFPVRRRG
ncbi:biliverdin-producing heme oxygenase [Nocardia terpenica]|uniref:Biliverdin-producing heme oxygenase n=1 Tax=Nocardia terpenica TaxID=455432 RepID=A0A291RIV2_9NOCA|nr:biliverdin-producing heme oxygenase [Nocardia terpenica]ATL67541.1 biliverdin-producing heme oxygenase [Nocardia terpenica]